MLLAGDLAVIASFALGGVFFHHVGGNPVLQALRIGTPFALAYLLVAAALGAFRWRRSGLAFGARTLLAWLAGMLAGFALRAWIEGYPPSLNFQQVALTYTGLLLGGYRLLFWLMRRDLARNAASSGSKGTQ